MGLNGTDTQDNLDGKDLFHHQLYRDFVGKNHIAMERLVPELLGEFDDAWEAPQQIAYVLASLRRLARDQNILNHEFDSVADGLLQVVNKILGEFSKEITAEINKLWVEVNLLYKRDVTMNSDGTITVTKTGNWQEGDPVLNFKVAVTYSVLKKSVTVAGLGAKDLDNASENKTGIYSPDYTPFLKQLQDNITAEATTRHADDVTETNARTAQDTILQQHIDAEAQTRKTDDDTERTARTAKDTDLQTQIDHLKAFTDKLIDNLNASGAYSGTKADYTTGTFSGHIAYGNINVYGEAQDGNNYIRTAPTSPNRSIAVGV